jgi:hypothetical protein
VVLAGEFSMTVLFWAVLFWVGVFWAGVCWAVAPMGLGVVIFVVVWGNNLGGCVAVEDEIVMEDGTALL